MKKHDIELLEAGLRHAHQSQEECKLSPQWHKNVMQGIHQTHALQLQEETNFMDTLQRMLFPFASATSAVAAGLALYAMGSLSNMNMDIFELSLDNTISSLSLQLMGLLA